MKRSFDVHVTEDQKDWKMDLLSLDPSLLERPAKQSTENFRRNPSLKNLCRYNGSEIKTKTNVSVVRL